MRVGALLMLLLPPTWADPHMNTISMTMIGLLSLILFTLFPASTSGSPSHNLDKGFTSLLHLIDSCSPAHRCFHPHVPSHQPAASPHHLHPRCRHQSCLWNSQAPPLSEVNRCRWRRGIKLRSVWFSTCQPKILAGILAG